jgi:hypothetical protein
MLILLAALVLTLQPVAPDAALARLAGTWSGEGTVLKSAARVELKWEWTLDGQFLRLTFANQMGPRRFEGHAYYRALGDGRYRGTWFDNSGMIRPIDARRDNDAIVSQWGTPETEVGETRYTLIDDDTMEIVDRVRGKDGSWREFGRVTVKRQRSSAPEQPSRD